MSTEYVQFTRKGGATCLPKAGQAAKQIVFLVQKKFASRFPKGPVTWESLAVSDFVFADGVLLKNRLNP
jgi:hypothetical protein